MRSLAPLEAGLAATALAVSIAAAPAAQAGTLHVQDDTHQLSPDGVRQVQRAVGEAPFDGRLLVTGEYPEAEDLSRHVHALVTSPDVVAVGIDPAHRHVQVHFGSGSSIPRSDWTAIERAGNDAREKGDFAGGATAIFTAAGSSVAGTVEEQPIHPGMAPSQTSRRFFQKLPRWASMSFIFLQSTPSAMPFAKAPTITSGHPRAIPAAPGPSERKM